MACSSDQPVIVIGAGAIGICCALSLVEAGERVCLIDRDEPGAGASFGNAGVISPWSVTPLSMPGVWRNVPRWLLDPAGPLSIAPFHAIKLAPWIVKFLRQATTERVTRAANALETLNQNNFELYRRHLAGTGFEDLIADCYYVHAFRSSNAASLDALEYRLREQIGADMGVIGASELFTLEPALSRDYQAAILIKGQARARSPGKICEVLAQKFVALGGEFVRGIVTALERQDDQAWRVVMADRTLSSPRIVVAAGAWSARLLKPLGVSLPLEGERGYHVEFPDPGVELAHSVLDVELKCVASSMSSGLRVTGMAEFADLDAPPNAKRIKILSDQARRILPDLNPAQMTHWMGVRPSTPDSLPFLGYIPGYKGLTAAFGHSHFGLMMAPRTGQLIAGLITGRTPNIDLSPYRVDRF